MSYKGSKKLCPMKNMTPCYKENCAWYLKHSKQCAIPLFASKFKKFLDTLEKGLPE